MAHSRGGWLMAGSITTAGAAAKIPRPCGSHRSFTGTVERYGFSRAVREGRAYTLPRVCIYAADCKSNTNGGTIARVPLFGDARFIRSTRVLPRLPSTTRPFPQHQRKTRNWLVCPSLPRRRPQASSVNPSRRSFVIAAFGALFKNMLFETNTVRSGPQPATPESCLFLSLFR